MIVISKIIFFISATQFEGFLTKKQSTVLIRNLKRAE